MAEAFKLTQIQHQAQTLIGADAKHVMLLGGSRSGKTFLNMRTVLIRALGAPESRHAVLRFRFNAVKQSIISDTLPKVMKLCWPELVSKCHLDKSDWFYRLPNGSEIWFGGLDDKERTEKILGQEFATIFLNECSQISWSSRNLVVTRLAQKVNTVKGVPLRLKMLYDCNPPGQGHWTYRLFIQGRSPDTRKYLPDPENYAQMLMNPIDNVQNLPDDYIRELEGLPANQRNRFLYGKFADVSENALWTIESLEQARHDEPLPDMKRIVIAIDPSGCSGEEDERSDEIGIIVAGLGVNDLGYVIEDLSGRHGPEGWAKVACDAFARHEADCIVAETNYGGAMVKSTIRAVNPDVPYREVKASRGKIIRAEPIAALYELGKVLHYGSHPELEDQLCAMTTAGYTGSKSPDRADACVWALTSLFGQITKSKKNHEHQQTRANVGHSALKDRFKTSSHKGKLRRRSTK